jgi:hypothetical protein
VRFDSTQPVATSIVTQNAAIDVRVKTLRPMAPRRCADRF